jgi:RNA ligase (TIGR02306 family)
MEDNMAERKLAYIATISKIEKIEGKDRIVYASIADSLWQVIVDKSFKVGDRVVYVEIDSILPVKPEYEFLRKRCYSEKLGGFLIKGMRMAGLTSFGLILPLQEEYKDKKDGFDMTDILGIRKKEDDISEEKPKKFWLFNMINYILYKLHIKKSKSSENKVQWPSFIPKTDEVRVENIPYIFSPDIKGEPVYVTEKIDGQSATYAVFDKVFYVTSRNVVLYRQDINKAIKQLNPTRTIIKANNYLKIAAQYNIPAILNQYSSMVIQGELAGPGIQKNPLQLDKVDLYIFNIYLPIAGLYYSWNGIHHFCNTNGLKTVPLIERKNFDWPDIKALKEYAKGTYPSGKTREGIVVRHDNNKEAELTLMSSPLPKMHNMWSFKCINDDYIL